MLTRLYTEIIVDQKNNQQKGAILTCWRKEKSMSILLSSIIDSCGSFNESQEVKLFFFYSYGGKVIMLRIIRHYLRLSPVFRSVMYVGSPEYS